MPDRHDLDEVSLIRQARDGDSQAFGQLYEVYAPRVFRFLNSHLDDSLDAEDITEETFLRVWRSLPRYRQRGVPFGGFVFRIARNALIDHYRRNNHGERQLAPGEEVVDASQPDPSDAVPARIEAAEVRALLDEMRDDYRTVLELRFLASLSPDEVAYAMKKSAGAVRVLQHRALAALRKRIDGNLK